MFLLLSLLELVSVGLLIPVINYVVYGTFKVHSVDLFTNLNQYIVTAEESSSCDGFDGFGNIHCQNYWCLEPYCAYYSICAKSEEVRLGRVFCKKYLGMDYVRYLSRRDSDGVYEVQIATTDYFTALQIGLKFPQ